MNELTIYATEHQSAIKRRKVWPKKGGGEGGGRGGGRGSPAWQLYSEHKIKKLSHCS